PKEPILSLHAKVTISKLNGQSIQVGSSPILINRCTNRTISFYSSIRLPVNHKLELSLQLHHLTHPYIFLEPTSISELDNGLFYYMADFQVRALSLIVQEQLNHSHHSRVDDFFEQSTV
ncbi:MAG: GGDEF domain-containing protein, partial [Exiguobacterium indicum]